MISIGIGTFFVILTLAGLIVARVGKSDTGRSVWELGGALAFFIGACGVMVCAVAYDFGQGDYEALRIVCRAP